MDKSEVSRKNGFGLNCLFNTISTEQLKAIFDVIPSSVVIVNTHGQFLYVNKRGLELYGIDYSGFEKEEHIFSLKAIRLDGSPFPLEDMPVSHSLNSGQVVRNVEMIIENANGIRYPVNVSSAPLYDNHGKMGGAVVIFEDFAERKQKVKELMESEEINTKKVEDKYRMLFNYVDQGFFVIDVIFNENDRPIDMYYVEANSKTIEILGRDFTGMRLREVDPTYEEYWFEIFGKVALTGQSIRIEQYAVPDKKWYSFYIFRIGDEKSRRIGNIFLDITEHKQMEKEIIEAKERLAKNVEEKYRMLFETMDEGFCTIDVIFNDMGKAINWRYLENNPQFANHAGLTDVAGKLVSELYPKTESIWFEFYGNVAKSGVSARIENEVKILNKWYDVYAFKIDGSESMEIGVLFRDITTRKLADEAVRKSEKLALDLVEKLHLADKNKESFINMLSHELRNPLASIMMSLDLLNKTPLGGKQATMALEIAKRQGKQLSNLVDDLLDVTRISQNKVALKKVNVELNEVTNRAVQDYQSQFIEKNVGLEVKLTSPIYIEADPIRLTQVIGNLLHNAAKFTNKNDQVIVSVSQDTDTIEAVIAVQDTGRGIDPKVIEELFQPFMQVDKSLDRRLGGLGLGLYIVKGMVELHGGRVEVFSEGIGKGTKFTLRLPLSKENNRERVN